MPVGLLTPILEGGDLVSPMSLAEALAAQSTRPSFRGARLKPKVDPKNPVWRRPEEPRNGAPAEPPAPTPSVKSIPGSAPKMNQTVLEEVMTDEGWTIKRSPARPQGTPDQLAGKGTPGDTIRFVMDTLDDFKGVVTIQEVLNFEKKISTLKPNERKKSRKDFTYELKDRRVCAGGQVSAEDLLPEDVQKKGLVPSQVCRIDGLCRYCMERGATTLDHVIPKSRGGSNKRSNLVGSCHTCNFLKGDRTPKEAGMVLHVPLRWFMYSKVDVGVTYTSLAPPTRKPVTS